MKFEKIKLVHIKRQDCNNRKNLTALSETFECFFVETCQRFVFIAKQDDIDVIAKHCSFNYEIYSGIEAYEFLLRLASGLESKIIAETEIFTQIKQAWQNFQNTNSSQLNSILATWFEWLFEDVKLIRAGYLQGLGGTSYGSLVRKLLNFKEQDEILLIGAGQLAQEILPYLTKANLFISNRTTARALELVKTLHKENSVRIKVVNDLQAAEQLATAKFLILCIPALTDKDQAYVELRKKAEWIISEPVTLHLGCLNKEMPDWSKLKNFVCLSDLFTLQKNIQERRQFQILKALRACIHLAKMRWQEGQLHHFHGWDDVADFAY